MALLFATKECSWVPFSVNPIIFGPTYNSACYEMAGKKTTMTQDVPKVGPRAAIPSLENKPHNSFYIKASFYVHLAADGSRLVGLLYPAAGKNPERRPTMQREEAMTAWRPCITPSSRLQLDRLRGGGPSRYPPKVERWRRLCSVSSLS